MTERDEEKEKARESEKEERESEGKRSQKREREHVFCLRRLDGSVCTRLIQVCPNPKTNANLHNEEQENSQ